VLKNGGDGVNGTRQGDVERQFFIEFTPGGFQIGLAVLNATAWCRPENERFVLPIYHKPDQEYLLRGVEQYDAG
jgi:hypothetical protein